MFNIREKEREKYNTFHFYLYKREVLEELNFQIKILVYKLNKFSLFLITLCFSLNFLTNNCNI